MQTIKKKNKEKQILFQFDKRHIVERGIDKNEIQKIITRNKIKMSFAKGMDPKEILKECKNNEKS